MEVLPSEATLFGFVDVAVVGDDDSFRRAFRDLEGGFQADAPTIRISD